MTSTLLPERGALYCRATGRRLDPRQGSEPTTGTPVAVAVFDDGTSLSIAGTTVVGREPQHDHRVSSGLHGAIIIGDERHQISRCHLLLRVKRWDVQVCDMGSRNGTWINSPSGDWSRITPGLGHRVADGQAIRLGIRCFRLHYLQRTPAAHASRN